MPKLTGGVLVVVFVPADPTEPTDDKFTYTVSQCTATEK